METVFYTIGDKEFYQDVASAWQKAKIVELVGGKDIPSLDAFGLLGALGADQLLSFYEILLVPKGMDKATFISHSLTPGKLDHRVLFATHIGEAMTLELLADFLAFILESSNLARMTEALGRVNLLFPGSDPAPLNGSSSSLPSSVEATPVTDLPPLR